MNDLPDITDGISDAEAETSATFDLTIDEVRELAAAHPQDAYSAAYRLRATLDRHAARGSSGGEYDDADVRAVLDNREQWRTLAMARADATDRLAVVEAERDRLRAQLAQHAPGPQLHVHRDLNGTDTHGDLDWCRHLAATCGGEVMTAYVCGYRSPWRPAANAAGDGPSAPVTRQEAAPVHGEGTNPSPTTAGHTEPCHLHRAPDCCNDGRGGKT